MPASTSPAGRRVIVTGAAGGIGRALVDAVAVLGGCDAVAAEWASAGIRCNVVMPGFIATPKVLGMPEQVKQSVVAQIPLQRFGALDELAGVVCFLLSPAAAYINGAVLRVDPGFGLTMR